MKTKYEFLPLTLINDYLPLIQKYKVSQQARKKNQFFDQYKYHGSQLPPFWFQKRENFITRHLVQYRANPTIRRRLALITWAFDPE